MTELHDLSKDFRDKHLSEMADVSQAVSAVFSAEKMNIESLGNGDSHLHWHLFPRKTGDLGNHGRKGKGPVWWLPFEKMYAGTVKASHSEIETLKEKLLQHLPK